jgi:hemolysin activation/secretion protein
VQVYVPEQELTAGIVRLQVSEGVVGKITIIGNKQFNDDNVRASLPHLKQGTAPNMRQLSENVQLANENPAKQGRSHPGGQ